MTSAPVPRNLAELQTPAPLVDAAILAASLARMAEAWPGDRLRPHVKAHKCTELARHQRDSGHPGFTCATVREVEGMAAAWARTSCWPTRCSAHPAWAPWWRPGPG
jgi:D-serine deaminase-like pyridoxal phosphate-dependent protein